MSTRRTALGGLLAAVMLATLLAPVALGQTEAPADTEILVLSNRADLLSGGDAYLEVVLPEGADPGEVVVDVDGTDVTDAFAVRPDGRFTGRVEGLVEGENVLTATLGDGSGARITLTNHPVGGPIFSGPQIQPWLCTTEAQGLGRPLDAQCNAPTKVEYFYVAEGDDAFAPYDPENPPTDVALTETDQGVTAPFIIRQETLTQNRGISRVAVLYDPAREFEPWAPQPAWNHKLFYPFGASCGTVHSQSSAQNVQDFTALSRGFLVATSSMNVLGNNCNTVTSAETVMMLKEHIQERYGSIRYTFGRGGSGGAIGQTMVSNNYPGLLQGITVSSAFPDNISTGAEVFDCHLLVQYLRRNPASPINAAQLFSEISGHGTSVNTCPSWEALFAPVSDPRNGCGVPADQHYNPETNPTGCRGTYQDFSEPVYGKRPESMWTDPERIYGGFAKGTYDNVGIQFGLQALREGEITPEQFVHLNENIGGFDIDFNNIPQRSIGDPGTPGIVYRTGQLVDGGQLNQVAIIDTRSTGNVDPLGIHTMHHSFVLKERLVKRHGTADNHVLYRGNGAPSAFDVMDEWLTKVEADTSGRPLDEKIIANKPERAIDSCYVNGQRRTDKEECDAAYPYYNAPRSLAAGGPFTHDVVKCQLKPLTREDDYGPLPITDLQWARLEAAFPQGVCDYSKPSAQFTENIPWLSYANGPGGEPLGDAPKSTPFRPDAAPSASPTPTVSEPTAPNPSPSPVATVEPLPPVAETTTVERLRGEGRVETAVALSSADRQQSPIVVIARADAPADALAGGPLAVALDAPLLLSGREELSNATLQEVQRLGATEAVLLGGESALGPQVEADLRALGVLVRRVSGANRYATAAAIAAELPSTTGILVASGEGFADALSASALGARDGMGILLVEDDRLPEETAAALPSGATATIVGGEGVVGPTVAAAIDERVGEVTRLSGSDRYATSAAVAQAAIASRTPGVVYVATGLDFPDALVAGAAAGDDRGILLLVDGTSLDASPATRDMLDNLPDTVALVRIAGGPLAVSPEAEQAITRMVSD